MKKTEWKLVIHLSADESYSVNAFRETHTRRGNNEKSKTIFYMEGDPRKFDTLDKLIKYIFDKVKSIPKQ